MKKYYLHNGKEQVGPYSIDDLKEMGLTNKTMVWFDGITNWTEAQFIPELKEFAKLTPPPFEKVKTGKPIIDSAKKVLEKDIAGDIEKKIPNKNKKNMFKWALIIFALIGLVFIIGKVFNFGKDVANNKSSFFSSNKNRLVGEWEPEEKYGKKKSSLVFNKDGTFITIVDGEIYTFGIPNALVKYECDESKVPHWIDILICDSQTNEVSVRLKGIYQYINENKIQLNLENKTDNLLERPTDFNGGSSTICNKKVVAQSK